MNRLWVSFTENNVFLFSSKGVANESNGYILDYTFLCYFPPTPRFL